MFSVMQSALGNLLTGQTLLYLMIGVFVGLVIGVLPVLGTAAGMALLIPFVYGMESSDGIAVMVGLLAVVPTGDTVTVGADRNSGWWLLAGHCARRLPHGQKGEAAAR